MTVQQLFQGLFDPEFTPIIRISDFLLCIGAALLAGLMIALGYMFRTRYTKSFVITLALLPAVVCMVIMMVNGNVGTGVAVAGAFSLVRFRSVPGTAKEIGILFLAMGAGLITGMGYLAFALLFTLILCGVFVIYNTLDLGSMKNTLKYRTLNITLPEDLDYSGIFDDILKEHTSQYALVRVKTANMGSMYRLTYHITLKNPTTEKQMMDALRCRNGNLEISVSMQESSVGEL